MDIKTLADLINGFVLAKNEVLLAQDIKHPTTIGSMYEGLTKTVLESSIFDGLNLKVIKNSFIKGCNTEFDVLLVEGDGEKIPFTDRYKYSPEQVIAIIQVKKNLYSADIEEGFSNLQFIIDYYENNSMEPYMQRLFLDSFRTIYRKDITALKNRQLNEYEESVSYILKKEAILPVRILWGYNGFKSEYSFREAFVTYLNKNVSDGSVKKIEGFGPHNFPNQIICDNFSVIKMTGMPFISPIDKDYWWTFLTTSSCNKAKFFLELIWTRLSYKYNLSMDIFGEDLEMEPACRFLNCKIGKIESGLYGWNYLYQTMSEEELKGHTQIEEWAPIELDNIQFTIISELCNKNEVDIINDEHLESFILTGNYSSIEDFLEKLLDTGLVYIEDNKLALLTHQCQCVIANGKYYAGENNSGRLTNWSLKEMNKSKR